MTAFHAKQLYGDSGAPCLILSPLALHVEVRIEQPCGLLLTGCDQMTERRRTVKWWVAVIAALIILWCLIAFVAQQNISGAVVV